MTALGGLLLVTKGQNTTKTTFNVKSFLCINGYG